MSKLAEAFVEVRADDRKLMRGLSGLRRRIGGLFGGIAASITRAGPLIGLTVGVGGLALATKGAVAAAITQQDAEAKLAAVIKATGGAAGFSTEQMKKMASQLQAVTTTGDEAVLGIQAVLSTFRNVSGDQFREATEATLDMANVMGTDARSAAIQLGKALNDPTVGLSALGRVGIQFTEQQKDQIKAMQASGDIAGSQAIILKELQGEFGGAARAAGKTFGGQMKQLSNIVGDLKEQIGFALMPVILAVSKRIRSAAESAMEWIKQNKGLGQSILRMGVRIKEVLGTIFTIWKNVFTAVIDIVASAMGFSGRAVSKSVSFIGGTIMSILDTLAVLSSNWGVAWELMKLEAFSKLREISPFLSATLFAWSKGFEHLQDNWNIMWENIVNASSNSLRKIHAIWSSFNAAVEEFMFNSPRSGFSPRAIAGAFEKAWGRAHEMIPKLETKSTGFGKVLGDAFTESFKGNIDKDLKNRLKKARNDFKSLVDERGKEREARIAGLRAPEFKPPDIKGLGKDLGEGAARAGAAGPSTGFVGFKDLAREFQEARLKDRVQKTIEQNTKRTADGVEKLILQRDIGQIQPATGLA